MTVPPDTKDWTWVLERTCAECGQDVASIARERVPGVVRDVGTKWTAVLAGSSVGERPSPTVWSPLEYGCHVRDVFDVFHRRVDRMVEEDDPRFDNWDQDATAIDARYGEQDPRQVAAELAAAASALADRFEHLTADEWLRTGRRSDGASFTVVSLARYMLHDALHHLHDVGAG